MSICLCLSLSLCSPLVRSIFSCRCVIGFPFVLSSMPLYVQIGRVADSALVILSIWFYFFFLFSFQLHTKFDKVIRSICCWFLRAHDCLPHSTSVSLKFFVFLMLEAKTPLTIFECAILSPTIRTNYDELNEIYSKIHWCEWRKQNKHYIDFNGICVCVFAVALCDHVPTKFQMSIVGCKQAC